MQAYIYGAILVPILIHCHACGMSEPSRIIYDGNGAIITKFDRTTADYHTILIELLQKLAPLTYIKGKPLDARPIEALIAQQVKLSRSDELHDPRLKQDKEIEELGRTDTDHSY